MSIKEKPWHCWWFRNLAITSWGLQFVPVKKRRVSYVTTKSRVEYLCRSCSCITTGRGGGLRSGFSSKAYPPSSQKKGTPKMDGFPRRVSFLKRGVGSAGFQVGLLLVLGRVMNCFPKRGVPVKGLEHSRLDDSSQCCICSRHLVMRLGFFGL